MFRSTRIFRRMRYTFWLRNFRVDARITEKKPKIKPSGEEFHFRAAFLSEETNHTRRKISSTRSFSTGFCKKSHAPASMAFFRLLFVPVEERMTILASG